MKGILVFKLPEEQEEFETAVNAMGYRIVVDEIYDKVFRPYYKHGYGDAEIEKFLESEPRAGELIDHLAKLYHQVIEDSGVRRE
jgi:hypothetical protein